MDLRNRAIHPNHPVGDAPGTFLQSIYANGGKGFFDARAIV